jgi:hypothetical protein
MSARLSQRSHRAALALLSLSEDEWAELMDPDHGETWPLPIAEAIRALDALSNTEWPIVAAYVRGES